MGGGVIGDLVGFVASTYMRGIPFIQIPTTLLSMVDASIGGKTGINTSFGKNLLGSFYHPVAIYMDLKTLETLPDREFSNGLAEVIKTAAIRDSESLDILENFVDRILNRDMELLNKLIFTTAGIKAKIVSQDDKENGIRCILNWGHTVGHAIEALLSFTLLHGECVSIGMLLEAKLSYRMGYLESPFIISRLFRILQSYNLPVQLPKNLSSSSLLQKMNLDKKNANSTIRCIILKSIGNVIETPIAVEQHLIESVLLPSVQIINNGFIQGKISIPGSKSISNRALLLAALGKGSCEIYNLLHADDTRVMLDALQQMGVSFAWKDHGKICIVTNVSGTLHSPNKPIYLGNAGTAARFLTTLCTLLPHGSTSILTGSERLKERPIQDLTDSLIENGCQILFQEKPGFFPIQVNGGGFLGGNIKVKADVSSQFVSSILLSAPYARKPVILEIIGEKIVSQSYIDMTLKVMKQFGIRVEKLNIGYKIWNGVYANPRKFIVEADASSATYLLALGAITGGEITISNLFPNSVQGDSQFYTLLEQMGCLIQVSEEYGITVKGPPNGQSLKGITVDMSSMTDAFMTLAILGAVADGTTRITNIANQRLKESNRILAMVTELNKCGIQAKELEDGIEIEGYGNRLEQLHGAEIDCYNDHRIAMSFSILGCKIPGIIILDQECVNKTYPNFWYDLETLGISIKPTISKNTTKSTNSPFSFPPLILIGMRGSGKTSKGKAISQALNFQFIDMDTLFEEKMEMSIQSYISQNGWNSFRFIEVNLLRDLLSGRNLPQGIHFDSKLIIATGGGIVETQEGRMLLESHKPYVIQIHRNIQDIIHYLKQDQTRANLGELPLSIWERRQKYYQQCSQFQFQILAQESNWNFSENDFIQFIQSCFLQSRPYKDIGEDFFLSLTCSKVEDIISDLKELSETVDALELRIDFLNSLDPTFLYNQIFLLKRHCSLPIIFTLRSKTQGGNFNGTEKEYFDILEIGKRSGCEFLDIEVCWSKESIDQFLSSFYQFSPIIISSFHDYQTFPITESLVKNSFLKALNQIPKAEILKVVLKAQKIEDVLILRHAISSFESSLASEQFKTKKLIAICAGNNGKLSRVLNSILTPVTHPKLIVPAAPGQLSVHDILQLRTNLGVNSHSLKFYLFGTSITHSLSPLIHNAGFQFYKINYEYKLFDSLRLDRILHRLKHPYFGGASVTIPYKQTICPYLDQLSPHAKAIGAVNTIKKRLTDGKLVGENTDWLALFQLIQKKFQQVHQLPTSCTTFPSFTGLILGAGGTSNAACYALTQLKLKTIYVFNRTKEKIKLLQERFGNSLLVCSNLEELLPNIHIDIIISTLPPTVSPPIQIPNSLLQSKKTIGVEVVYRPRFTSFLESIKKAECPYIEGIEMLIEQAFFQFEIFTDGKKAPQEEIKKLVFQTFNITDLPSS